MSDQSAPAEPGEILTFYSYKGGTGRSMVLANTACLLAQQPEGYKGVLIVDWDLEAPGLHRYFADRFQRRFDNPKTATADLEGHPGLIDFFIALAAEIEKLPPIAEEPTPDVQESLARAVNLDSYILPTDVPFVSILKAGAFDETYAKRVNTFAWEPLYTRAPWVISLVADWFTSRFRYTLIDSRTGITDTSGICTMLLPDKLVAVFTPNQQSLDGVLQMVERSTNYRRRSSDLRPLSVFPLPSRIEASEPTLREQWRKGEGTGYQPRFEALFRKVWELERCSLDSYFNEVQIQHASAYAYGEKIAVLLEKSNDRTSLRRAYVSFVEILALDEPWDAAQPSTVPEGTSRAAESAESAYAQLIPGGQESAKRLFLQLVSMPQGSSKPAVRERALKALSDDAQSLVQVFVAASVLSIRTAAEESFIYMMDENLPSTWRRLAAWIEADIEFLHWRDALDAAMANWDKFGRSKEGLMRGRPLAEAETWFHSRFADLNDPQIFYIASSISARKRRKIVQWTLSVTAGAVALLALFAWIGFRDQAEAEALLGQGGIDNAIRAERIYSRSPETDTRLRTLLNQFPQPLMVLPNSVGSLEQMLFNKDATRLAVAYVNRVASFQLTPAGTPFDAAVVGGQSLVFSPDGKWLAFGSDSDRLRRMRNLQTGRPDTVPFVTPVTAIAFSADASKIATGTADGSIYISTIPDTKTIHVSNKSRVNALAFSPNGQALASASSDRTAQLWTTDSGRNFAILEHPASVGSVVYSPSGDRVATGALDHFVRIWLSQKDAPALAAFPGLGGFLQMTFSPDGRFLAFASDFGIGLVDMSTLKSRILTSATKIEYFALAAGNRIVAGGTDGTIYTASLNDTRMLPRWKPSDALGVSLRPVYFSNDGSVFAVQTKAGPIAVFKSEIASQTAVQSLTGLALADAACRKLKPLAKIDPDYSKACPAGK